MSARNTGLWALSFLFLAIGRAQPPAPSGPDPVAAEATETQQPVPPALAAAPATVAGAEAVPAATQQRTQLNLAGQTNTSSGESQRNENNRVNPLDTNTEQELNQRVGTTATLIGDFQAERNYFASEYGRSPAGPLHLRAPGPYGGGIHGSLFETHQNSVTSARTFFQVGGVLPARENNYGFRLTSPLPGPLRLTLDGSQQKSRGYVNGNILVPPLDERTPLTTDPALYALLSDWIAGYPAEPPNLPLVDARALNTNAPQSINTNAASGRLDSPFTRGGQLSLRYAFTSQQVDAFQLVAGNNPDSDVHNHTVVLTWNKALGPAVVASISAGFDRVTTSIRPDESAPPLRINISNLTNTGLDSNIPIQRVQNRFRYAAGLEGRRGRHSWSIGGEVVRTQINSLEQELKRAFISFQNNFGNSALTNFRLGLASSAGQLLGDTYRGYRTWKFTFYADDAVRLTNSLSVHLGLRYEPFLTPTEVNHRETLPFGCSCGALGPQAGIAYRLPGRWGMLRTGYALSFGQMYQATFGQIRMNLPNAARVVVNNPDPLDPLGGLTLNDLGPGFRSAYYDISDHLGLPYTHSYNFTWEFEARRGVQVQLGYVGSRSQRLYEVLFLNRARRVDDLSQMTTKTINDRRPDPTRFDVFRVHNGAKSYFDAARVTVTLRGAAGFNGDISYWFSKAIDFGTDYTSTVAGPNARQGRAPSEFGVHDRMKGLSSFDQPHALLTRLSYQTPEVPPGVANGFLDTLIGRWTISGVWLLKSGTPFRVNAGGDSPGIGNVDGQGSDRPDLLDPSILGRTIGDPDTSEQLLPRSAFAFHDLSEDDGNLGRNTFRRGKLANVNAAIDRRFTLPQDWTLQFRAEAVNLFNTPQFDQPNQNLTSPTFAKITNTLNGGRAFRFRLTVNF